MNHESLSLVSALYYTYYTYYKYCTIKMTKSNDSMFIRFQLSDFWFSKRFKSLRANSKAPKTTWDPAVFAGRR